MLQPSAHSKIMQASHATITVIDFEGTGAVKGYPDEPWQIGLIQIINGKVQPATITESLLRVGERPFNRYAPGRHAELRSELTKAPTLQTVWPQLRYMLAGIPQAAHNAATENRYLSQAFPLHPPGKWIDTLKLSRIAFPNIKSYKLEDLTETLALTDSLRDIVPARTAHDALYDAAACALLLEKIISLPGWENVTINALQNA
jgi:DNA polymerase III epsilon subunit-like protein